MSETIVSQLKEYANVIVEDMLVENAGEFTEDLQAAFERAMDFSQLICPSCWIKENQTLTLSTLNKSDTTESYCCEKCGFDEELGRAI